MSFSYALDFRYHIEVVLLIISAKSNHEELTTINNLKLMRTFKIFTLVIFSVIFLSNNVFGQDQRGYYDAPYVRYEADQGVLTHATLAMMSFNQKDLQSEASEQVCVNMSAKDA